MHDALQRAIDILGGPAAAAKAIGGLKSQAISQWKRVPAERVLAVESLTGISRHILRPDVFGASPESDETAISTISSPNDGGRAAEASPCSPPPGQGEAAFSEAAQ